MFTLILGPLISALVPIIPALLTLVNNWMTMKENIQLKEMQYEFQKVQLQEHLAATDINATVAEGNNLRLTDAMLDGTGWLGILRSVIRPAITIVLFGTWCILKLATFVYLVHTDGFDPLASMNVIFDPTAQGMLMSVFGFWFGSRMVELYGPAPRNPPVVR
jgi:hypothetical protein